MISLPNIISLGKTLLMYAAQKGSMSFVDHLIENQADVRMVDKYGQNALFYAIDSNDEGVISLIVSAGSDINQESNNRSTPLMKAI